MQVTCKNCGKPVFWLGKGETSDPRWIHRTPSIKTPCYGYDSGDKRMASPFSFNNYIKLIK